jgi:hypothetical protein
MKPGVGKTAMIRLRAGVLFALAQAMDQALPDCRQLN